MSKRSFYKPLLFKLTSLALVVTLLSVGVTTFFVARFAHDTLRDRVQSDLLSDAHIVRLTLEEALARELFGPEDLQNNVESISEESDRMITIMDRDGTVLADTVSSFTVDSKEELISVSIPFADEGVLHVAIRASEIDGMLQGLIQGSILIGLVVAAAAFLVAYFLNRAITGPLQDLLVVVRRLQNREFGRRVLVRSNDEVGQLGRAFNELSETLEELFAAISDREGKLDAILSSMDDGVLAVNMQRKVILANKAVSDMFGIDSDEIIGKNQFEATRNTKISKLLDETMDSKQSISREVRVRPGSERIIAVTSSPLKDQDGSSLGAVAVLRDVTALRHLEQMRQEFVANVSHELRTPLTSIKGFVETLLNGNLDDKEVLERFLNIINNETDRMIVLINDLLDLSRIESGKQSLSKEPVDIKKIFDDTITVLQSKADAKDITLENNIYNPIIVEGDPKLLRQVAINLVDNGIKYTPEGGKVWVEAEPGLDDVEIIVSDNGLGIQSQHLDRIFERFYRVDKGRARNMGGTGLGLAIVKHIVDKHKGTICAESRIGKGTKMRITLKRMN
ncbi:MAG: cell wall metabolism sensor histidine kinase WalK [Firmicutes bacterium]|nr:cell wall metabolism sensor histidine kinase WalK [Bacillota bacterium]